jgi:hypothetical protein
MLLKLPMIVLGSHLVIAVADDVTKFDIAKGCKLDSASAFDPNAGMAATIKRCVDDEERPKDQLKANWSSFSASDRTMCVGAAVGDGPTRTLIRRVTLICRHVCPASWSSRVLQRNHAELHG